MTECYATLRGLRPPARTDLPYFAYGLFKPGELAYGQIEAFLDREPTPGHVRGALYARDGLPLLLRGGKDLVSGQVLIFDQRRANEAYERISAFEPKKHYSWGEVTLHDSGERANVLFGKKINRGSVLLDDRDWSGRRDPVLTDGLRVVDEQIAEFAGEEFRSAPPDAFDWPRLFRLQMAYLFLWTIIERYTALSFGPTLESMERVRRLGEDPAFARALKTSVSRTSTVYDSRNPENKVKLDRNEPAASAKYYYAVRSNLSHRGKGAWRDGEIVRQSLRELRDIMGSALRERSGNESVS